jgi:tetratricopeptide (TPR) repeat protein
MARGHHNLGLLFEQQKKELDGIAELGKSVAILQEIVGSPKTSAEALFLLEKTFEQRARINTKLGRHADAAREFEAIIDLPGPKMPARRFHHAIACIRAGEVNRGLAEIEEVIALKNLPKGWVFMAASAYARASEERQVGDRISTEMRTGFANKAVEFLRQGQAARLFESADEIDLLKTHNDLDPLRTRDDFKQLLKEVEEKAKPKDKE